ncbi:MAG: class C beta-lactamase-related serine hydrolase [Bacteroidetes bacterium]|nr:MAG: class C beta-lactamase-related serine hydrolase [Bacteroidota bacterium]
MNRILKATLWTVLPVLLAMVGIIATGNQFLLKGLWAAYLHGNTSATIDDARFFDTRTVEAGTPAPWKVSDFYYEWDITGDLRKSLEETETVAFLMIKDGEIVFEEYWDGYSDSSRSNSFSMAKSITTMLVQCAIQDGYIKSWDQKVKDFLPELKGEFADDLTLRHLCTMTAGLDFNEHYKNPFDITAKLYYGHDAEQLMLQNVPVVEKPGRYEYQSGATQFLGLALMRATGKTEAEYASEKLWKPLGAEHAAEWHLDSENGKELSFCCFNSNARDFARFGQMMLQHGNFNGTQILDSAFVDTAIVPFAVPYYGHSFWLCDDYGTHVFYQRGILGQYIIVIPEYDLVIVRLGHTRLGNDEEHSSDFRVIVKEVLTELRGGV